jgi:hypothetical protein
MHQASQIHVSNIEYEDRRVWFVSQVRIASKEEMRSGFHDSEKRRFREVVGSHLSLTLSAKDYDLNGAFVVRWTADCFLGFAFELK